VAPSTRSCPVKLSAGEFWDPSAPSRVDLTNTTEKTIRRISVHAGYFANTVQNLNGVPYEWLWIEQTPPHAKKTLDLTAERFLPNPLISSYDDQSVLGLIVYPGRIEYTDGSVWTPHQPAECYSVYWRHPDNHPQLQVLPPFQLDELEQEDVD
jgi:hypothetical protein